MPVKTKSGKWRWGNVERDTKKDLAQTVWGIWKKNGSKGDFGKFFKTGKVNESDLQPNFKQIGFPDTEISVLKSREEKDLPIYTTRVADDFSDFRKGDIVITPWQSLYIVTDETVIGDIDEHPFREELTPGQVGFLSNFDEMKILKLERVNDDTGNQIAQIEIQDLFNETVKTFNEKFGIDLSYMRLNISSVPHYTNGEPSDLPVEEFAGSWLEDSSIEICPDMSVPMKTFGVDGMSEIDFTRRIIAHELAHEIWNKMPEQKKLINDMLSEAKSAGFSTAYLKTVSPGKYEQELFCEYMARLIVRDTAEIEFRLVKNTDLTALLNEVDTYNENLRYDKSQFEKYLGSTKGIDQGAIYYGLFRNEKCEALSYLNKTPGDFILLAQIASFVKGSGKLLIENILNRSRNIWWVADPEGGESLVNYYRQFGLEEHLIKMSKWTNTPEYAFFKVSDDIHRQHILEELDKVDMAV